ncbi:hypothetical protein [Intestinibacillus massiliensis]
MSSSAFLPGNSCCPSAAILPLPKIRWVGLLKSNWIIVIPPDAVLFRFDRQGSPGSLSVLVPVDRIQQGFPMTGEQPEQLGRFPTLG